LHTILHRTDLIVFPLTLQTITTAQMMSIWGKGGSLTFDLDIRSQARFCAMHLTAKFQHPTFNRSEVIMLTNKQTNWQTNRCRWKHPPRSAMLRRWVKICPQPRQNATATKRATNMASSDMDDDVIVTSGVLLSGAFVNMCKKKAYECKVQTKHMDSSMHRTWKTRSISQPRYKGKNKQTTTDQSPLSIFCNLLHRLEQVAILIWVAQLVAQSWATQQQPTTDVQQKSCSKAVQQKSTCVIGVSRHSS